MENIKIYVVIFLILTLMVSCDKIGGNNNGDGGNDNPLEPFITLDCSYSDDILLEDHNPNGVDYIVPCGLEMRGGTLEILPGTTILFEDGASLEIVNNAKLIAQGSATNQIRFINEINGIPSWAGIFLDTEGSINIFDHVIIEGAGAVHSFHWANNFKAGITVLDAQISMKNTQIVNSGDAGLVLINDINFTEFENNTIKGSQSFPVVVDIHHLDKIDFNTWSFTDNGAENIRIDNTNSTVGEIRNTFDLTIPSCPIPYFMGLPVECRADLTISAGVEILMGAASFIEFSQNNISFKVNGTPTDRTIIRGAISEAGFWKGVILYNNSIDHKMINLDISDAGGDPFWQGERSGNIALKGFKDQRLIMENCTSTRSLDCDIALYTFFGEMDFENINSGDLIICEEAE